MTRELIRSWAVCLLLGLLAVGYLTRWFHGSGEQSRGTP